MTHTCIKSLVHLEFLVFRKCKKGFFSIRVVSTDRKRNNISKTQEEARLYGYNNIKQDIFN